MDIEGKVAEYLLQIQAVKLQPKNPFTWASGLKSPIYCDNRKILSYPKIRKFISDSFSKKIRSNYPKTEGIAAVATGAIAHGALVAETLDLPLVYIRSSHKSHGLKNSIEGVTKPSQKFIVIEDLISTGGSSLNAIKALHNVGCNVLGLYAIFSYGFKIAKNRFESINCNLYSLSNYDILIKKALQLGEISDDDLEILNNWSKNPENW